MMRPTLTTGTPAQTARAVCVFLHGRGQNAEQMVTEVISSLDAPDVHFVLPQSPGIAWYDAKAVDEMTEDTAAQLAEALTLVRDAVEAARQAVPDGPLVIAGFSQGACLAIEYLLRGGNADAAAVLTGCRVGASGEDLPEELAAPVPVFVSNGDADPWIPLWASQKASEALIRQGARVHSEVFAGREHLVSKAEIIALSKLLNAVVAGRELAEYRT